MEGRISEKNEKLAFQKKGLKIDRDSVSIRGMDELEVILQN